MALIEFLNVTREAQNKPLLHDITLALGQGESFALIGPTGAGKTTLLRLMDLLDRPSAGQINFDGIDVTRSGRRRLEARRRMALVQQKPIVFSTDVFGNVACGLRWRHEPREAIRKKVLDVLELVDMAAYRNRDGHTLSGGETQRVAIARALVTRPELLLLDEPTANLDPVSTARIEAVLARIIREKQTAIVMATHDMFLGQRLAERIGVLMGGELVQTGNKGEIFHHPQNMKVAGFVGMENILQGTVTSNENGIVRVDVNGKPVEAVSDYPPGERVHACIRPEDIILSLTKSSSSARNTFEGNIRAITSWGPFAHIELDCGFPLVGLITFRSAQEMELEMGKRIFASFKATAVHVIKS